jgi:hypothetical protein
LGKVAYDWVVGYPSLQNQAIDHSMGHQTRVTGDEVLYRVVDLELNAGEYPLGGHCIS